MRDNFRPNVRLTTNILMVIGTFLIAFNIAPIAKEQDQKTYVKSSNIHGIGIIKKRVIWINKKQLIGMTKEEKF